MSQLSVSNPEYRRYYSIGGMTIQVDADLPMNGATFAPKFRDFETREPGEDVISIGHHFEMPPWQTNDLGDEVYRKAPWSIRRKGDQWLYLGISPDPQDPRLHCLAVMDRNHSRTRIFSHKKRLFRKGNLSTLTMFPTDQILLAPALAERQGCIMHAAGAILGGKGLLFVGHSEAGKSTTVRMLQGRAQILCDDRIIVRRSRGRFNIYGTWCHGDVPDVSSASAPLAAVFFLQKSANNRLIPIEDRRLIVPRILSCLVKPFVTAEWWQKSLDLIHSLVNETPFYEMEFDKTGRIVPLIKNVVEKTLNVKENVGHATFNVYR
jgi:hypothetical protein